MTIKKTDLNPYALSNTRVYIGSDQSKDYVLAGNSGLVLCTTSEQNGLQVYCLMSQWSDTEKISQLEIEEEYTKLPMYEKAEAAGYIRSKVISQ